MKPNTFNGMLSVFRPPLVYELTGREFDLEFDDGYDRRLVFRDRKTLLFGPAGEEQEYPYECLKGAERCYFLNFEDVSLRPRLAYTLVLDLEQDLVTMVLAHVFLNPKIPGMPSADYVFGAIRRGDGTVNKLRHGFTTEMVGKSISWNYGYFDIAHVYATERYYRVSFTPRGMYRALRGRPELRNGGMGGRTPSPQDIYEDYLTVIKIRERVYLVSLLETVKARQQGAGSSIVVLMNLDQMHDVGRDISSYGGDGNGNHTLGAFGVFHDASSTLAKPSTLYIR